METRTKVLYICPKAESCQANACSHKAPHLPDITTKHNSITKRDIITNHC